MKYRTSSESPRSRNSQPDLFSAKGDPARRPRVNSLIPRLVAALDAVGAWVGAPVLCAQLGTDPRSLREAANKSGGRVLGHQKGYISTAAATLGEVQQVERRLLSQSNRMRARVLEIRRVRYGTAADFGGAA